MFYMYNNVKIHWTVICLRVLYLIVLQQMIAGKRNVTWKVFITKISKQISVKYKETLLHNILHQHFVMLVFLSSQTHTYKLLLLLLAHIQGSKYHRYINLFRAHFVNFYHQMKFATFGMHNIEFSLFSFFPLLFPVIYFLGSLTWK